MITAFLLFSGGSSLLALLGMCHENPSWVILLLFKQ